MGARVELADGDVLVGVFEHGGPVTVRVEVVGGGKDGDNGGEFLRGCLAMHGVSAVR